MGECLIKTLEDTLEEGTVTPAAKLAWIETYDALSGDMVRAQKEHRRSSK
jgi:hemoglobin-like flavoprotein